MSLSAPLAPDDEAPWPAPNRAWWAVAMFCIAAVLSYSDRQVLSLLVDPLKADLHATDFDIGMLQGAGFSLIYAVAGLALGRAADVLPRKAVILTGIAIWSIATVACGYASSFTTLFIARAAVGIGEAALTPAALSIITDSFRAERRGAAIGIFLMGMMAGSGLAIAAGGLMIQAAQAGVFRAVPLLGSLAPWRTVLVSLGVMGLPVGLLIATVAEPPRRRRSAALPATAGPAGAIPGVPIPAAAAAAPLPLREALARFATVRSALVPLYAAMGLSNLCDYALLSWTPALLSRRFALGAGEIGTVLGTIVIVAGMLGAGGAGMLADRLVRRGGDRARLRLACGIVASGVVGTLLVAAPSPVVVFALLGIWTLASNAGQSVGLTVVQEIAPSEIRGLSVSVASLVNIGLGLALGAALPALMIEHVFHDPRAVGAAITLVALPAALAATLLYRRAMATVVKVAPV